MLFVMLEGKRLREDVNDDGEWEIEEKAIIKPSKLIVVLLLCPVTSDPFNTLRGKDGMQLNETSEEQILF